MVDFILNSYESNALLKSNIFYEHIFFYQVESTRLDGVNHYTPLHIKQTNYVFSPIVFDTENIENNTPENKTEEGTFAEEEGSETFDISFTRYQLSDLTERLGGTGLSYSKVN